MSGAVSFHAGFCAETAVERHYEDRGCTVAERRWRGAGGEIDLILRNGRGLIFVEVKKSRSFARAAERVSERQLRRIYSTAAEYLMREPAGLDTEARFDIAMVDATGQISILENIMT